MITKGPEAIQGTRPTLDNQPAIAGRTHRPAGPLHPAPCPPRSSTTPHSMFPMSAQPRDEHARCPFRKFLASFLEPGADTASEGKDRVETVGAVG